MMIQTKQISPNLNGTANEKQISVPVPYAKDGSVSNSMFDTTKDCAVQKETGSSIVYTEADAKQLHISEEELSDDGQFSPSAFIQSCMTGEDVKDLSEEETPLEEYTSSQLERAVSRVKEQRTEKRQAIDDQVSKEQDKEDAIEQHLLQSGLPVSAENATRLSNAVDMTTDIDKLSQDSMKFFIGSGKPITPENIISSNSASNINASINASTSAGNTAPSADFEVVQSQVESILEQGGMDVSEENMDTAKWLYENELPVTVENIKRYQEIQDLQNLDMETMINRIVDDMVDGMIPEKADLTKISRAEAADEVDQLLSIDDTQLRKTYVTEADFITAKRQLEEIRLSMTVEAARTMAAKGITLDVTNLSQIVEELKQQEQQAKESLMLETGTEPTFENTQVMSGTIQAAKNVLAAPIELLAHSFVAEDTENNLQQLADSATDLTEQYNKAGEAYESVGTEVRRDLGDSMTKAFQNVDDILDDLGLDITGMNQRAVRILAYNQMPITEDSIINMKEYDSRVTTLMQNMKPSVVSQLIQNEVNPLEISLDELSEQVSEIQENTTQEDISLRKYLWKMDRQGDLSSEERQSLIGVYRLLDKVEKSDGAVIGQVVKEGKELSLSNLLSATRTRKAEGLDVQIEDNFSEMEQLQTSGVSISDQIQAAYGGTMVSQLKKTLSPHVMRDNDSMDLSLEELLEVCQNANDTDVDLQAYYDQMVTQLTMDVDDPEGKITRFLKALDLPDSAANMALVKQYMSSGAKEYTSLWTEAESDEITQSFDDPETLASAYEEIDEKHMETLETKKERDDITYNDVISLAQMAGNVSFYQTLRNSQTYEVPIFTEQGVTNCNVTIRQERGSEKGTVEISMDSEDLGRIQASFKVIGRQIKGFVTAEKADSLEECQTMLSQFEKDLEENGFTMESKNLVQGSRRSLQVGDKAVDTKNRDLYQVAKIFIVNVNGKDDEK